MIITSGYFQVLMDVVFIYKCNFKNLYLKNFKTEYIRRHEQKFKKYRLILLDQNSVYDVTFVEGFTF